MYHLFDIKKYKKKILNFFYSVKKNLFYLLTIFFILFQANFFTNLYIIGKNNYEHRMTKNAGYCNFEGYGFVLYLYNKYKFSDNIKVINFRDFVTPYALFYDIKKFESKNYLILIGANETQLKKFNNYLIIDKFEDCFLIKI